MQELQFWTGILQCHSNAENIRLLATNHHSCLQIRIIGFQVNQISSLDIAVSMTSTCYKCEISGNVRGY